MEGWISIHRKITDHPDYFSEPFTRMGAWIDLLILANHKPNVMRVRGIKITIKRGETAMAQETLAMRWKWSRGKVKRYLADLAKDGQIVQQKSNVINCISILNYENYQSSSTSDNTPNRPPNDTPSDTADNTANSTPNSTANGATNGHQIVQQTVQQTDINNNYNKINNDNNNTHIDFLSLKISSRERERARECLDWIVQHYPAVQQMPEPLTADHAELMLKKLAPADIQRIIMAMDNKSATKNKSAYATFCAFAGKDLILKERREALKGKLYTYTEVCDFVHAKRYKQSDFVQRKVGDSVLWAKITDVSQQNQVSQ